MRRTDLPRALLAVFATMVTVAGYGDPAAWAGEFREFLYAKTPTGALATYEIEPDGSLKWIARLDPGGKATSLAVQPGGKFAYSDGGKSYGLKCYTVDPRDGRLLPNPVCDPSIQVDGPLAISPDGRFLYVSWVYGVYSYAIDQATGKLSKTGINPELPLFTESGKYAYAFRIHLYNAASYRVGADGLLRPAADFNTVATGTQPQAMAIDPGGYFAYIANPSDDSISQYLIDPRSGMLRPNPHEATISVDKGSSSLLIDRTGRFLYCAAKDSIVQFRISPDGTLKRFGEFRDTEYNERMLTDPSGRFVWLQKTAGRWKTILIGFSIARDGSLVPLNSEPVVLTSEPGQNAFATTSWIGPKPEVQIAKHDLGPLLTMKVPIAGTFTPAGRMAPPIWYRVPPFGTLMPDGRALIVEQGFPSKGLLDPDITGEIYDPNKRVFSPAGFRVKSAYAIARLRDGSTLIGLSERGRPDGSVVILDPVTMRTRPAGHLKLSCFYGRRNPLLLADGRILFPYIPINPYVRGFSVACEGEIFDPSSGKSIGLPDALSDFQVLAVAPDGRLFVLSWPGLHKNQPYGLSTAHYLYDITTGRMQPVAGQFTHFPLGEPVVLKDGKLLLIQASEDRQTEVAELLDPVAAKLIPIGSLPQPHSSPEFTLLLDGRVLITEGSVSFNTAELFDPATRTFTPTGPMTTVRDGAAAVVLSDGNVLFAGGDWGASQSWESSSPYDTAEIYHPPPPIHPVFTQN